MSLLQNSHLQQPARCNHHRSATISTTKSPKQLTLPIYNNASHQYSDGTEELSRVLTAQTPFRGKLRPALPRSSSYCRRTRAARCSPPSHFSLHRIHTPGDQSHHLRVWQSDYQKSVPGALRYWCASDSVALVWPDV